MLDELEARRRDEAAPGLQGKIRAVSQPLLPLDVGTAGVASEEHPACNQRSAELLEDSSEFLGRHVKKDRVRKDAVEPRNRQLKGQEILLPDFATGGGPGHRYEGGGTVEPHWHVSAFDKGGKVAPRTTAEIEDALLRGPGKMAEQCIHVLRDVVVFGSFPEVFGVMLVVRHSGTGEGRQLFGGKVNQRARRF